MRDRSLNEPDPDRARGVAVQSSAIAQLVARAIKVDPEDDGQVDIIEEAIARRLTAAFSDIPAVRVEGAAWLIRESGTDAPDAIDLWVAAANDAVRELGRERGWDGPTTEKYAARLSNAFEAPLRRALVADEEQSVER